MGNRNALLLFMGLPRAKALAMTAGGRLWGTEMPCSSLWDCHGEPSVSFADSSPVYGFCNPKQVLDRISPEDCGAFVLAMTAKMKTALIGIYPRGRLLRGLLCGGVEGGEGVLVLLALL